MNTYISPYISPWTYKSCLTADFIKMNAVVKNVRKIICRLLGYKLIQY